MKVIDKLRYFCAHPGREDIVELYVSIQRLAPSSQFCVMFWHAVLLFSNAALTAIKFDHNTQCKSCTV